FLMITSFAGVGAVTRAPIGVIRSVPETRRLLEDVLAEIVTVARARRVDLPEKAADAALEVLERFEPASTASMQRDITEGLPSELEFLTGAVVRLGHDAGVATPVNRYIYRSLLPSEQRARGAVDWPGS
ncbi:MAG: ketopantoate reductase family protein, partial [Actinomycetota bacterium]